MDFPQFTSQFTSQLIPQLTSQISAISDTGFFALKSVKITISVILAVIPAGVWAYYFHKREKTQKNMCLYAFIMGAVMVAPLLFYKYLWQFFPWINAFRLTHPFKSDLIGFSTLAVIPLDVILTFMIVGIIEESTKFFAVKMADKGRICCIDDAIEKFIMAALGFSFIENILYFYSILTDKGLENIFYPFMFRSIFSTFAHILFSGVLGYFYGLAFFANDILKEEHKAKHGFIKKFARIINFRKETVFSQEKIAEGLLAAIILHAVFNIFLEMNWTFLLVPYLTGGFIYINYLLDKKEDHKAYDRISCKCE